MNTAVKRYNTQLQLLCGLAVDNSVKT